MQAGAQERDLKDLGGKEVACERAGVENNLTGGGILAVNSGQPKAILDELHLKMDFVGLRLMIGTLRWRRMIC